MVLSSNKKISALLRGITSKNNSIIIFWVAFIGLEQKTNLNFVRRYAKIKKFNQHRNIMWIVSLINNENLIRHHLYFCRF